MKRTKHLSPDFANLLTEHRTQLFSVEALSSDGFGTVDAFDAAERKPEQPSLLFFDPPSISQRIVNQFAFFSVMPDPCFDTQEWLEAHDAKLVLEGRDSSFPQTGVLQAPHGHERRTLTA